MLACFLFGCTDLEVFRLAAEDTAPIEGGMSYYLPRSAITLTGTVTLTACDPKAANTDSKFIEVSASIAPVVSTEPDPDYHYYISYEKARSWMKEINFSVNSNPNGTLQSFNTTINDQAGPIIVAAIGAAVQVGGAVTLGLVPKPSIAPGLLAIEDTGGAKHAPPTDYCKAYLSDSVYAALQTITEQNALKKTITSAPSVAPADIAAQTQAAQEAQSKIDAAIKKATLTRSFSFKWIPGRHDLHGTVGNFEVIDRKIDVTPLITQWFNDSGKNWLKAKPPLAAAKDPEKIDPRQSMTSPFHATLSILKGTMGGPGIAGAEDPSRLDASDGLIIRDPSIATLRICREVDKGCMATAAVQADNALVETTEDKTPRLALRLPQFGRVMVLTSKSGLFENSVLNATLNSDGTISTIGFHYSNSLAAGLNSLGTAAGSASSAITAQNAAIAARNTASAAVTTATTAEIQAPDTYNKALADCLTQRAAIIKAGGTPAACQ
jgi:hypothetical protein